jgi:hypothetical protein
MLNSAQLRRNAAICWAAILSRSGKLRSVVDVVHRRHRQIGAFYAPACRSQTVERLRGSDLVNEMQVNVEERGFVCWLANYVVVPELVEECAWQ